MIAGFQVNGLVLVVGLASVVAEVVVVAPACWRLSLQEGVAFGLVVFNQLGFQFRSPL